MSKCDERFARQYRYEPPPEFPLASPSSGIVHHLSGPDRCAPLKPFTEDQDRLTGHALHFHCALELATLVLAHASDSLVRVSRRVGCARAHQPGSRATPKPQAAPKPCPRPYGPSRNAADRRGRSAPRALTTRPLGPLQISARG